MRSRLNWAFRIVVAVALFGAPAPARAQSDRTDSPVIRQPQESASRAEVTIDDLQGRPGADVDRARFFRAVNTTFLIAASADLSVSMYQIGRGNAREVGFGAQWQNSPLAFAVSKSAMSAAFALGLQRLHKHRPKTALVLGIIATGVEGWLTVRSASISPQ